MIFRNGKDVKGSEELLQFGLVSTFSILNLV